ncbi:hypothetical protein HY522_05390 [bacterium]|nr:hypothetical protein [bacterium]
MRKGNGSNGMSARLKRATVLLIEGQAQSRQEMAAFRRDMVEMRRENQKMFAEMVRRNDRLEEETASLKGQTASLKKVSDIHTKAIMRILDKI